MLLEIKALYSSKFLYLHSQATVELQKTLHPAHKPSWLYFLMVLNLISYQ